MNFETSVRIRRTMQEVFDYVADPVNLPSWNSAVQTVSRKGETYSMRRTLPTGHAENELEVVAHEPPVEFAIRTTSGPTPFAYRYAFSSERGETLIRMRGEFAFEGAVALLGPLAARAVKRGVDDNLAELKRILEAHPG
jgi:carbon monoxide dehydrogenase subunit G